MSLRGLDHRSKLISSPMHFWVFISVIKYVDDDEMMISCKTYGNCRVLCKYDSSAPKSTS